MTGYLVDTQVWLWAHLRTGKLSRDARRILEDNNQYLLLSTASIWELTIKHALGKLKLPEPPGRYVPRRLKTLPMQVLPIETEHALAVDDLPLIHDDPFDRMLVAQCRCENLQLLSADAVLEDYPVTVVW